MINDCEAVTGWTGDDAVTAVTAAGLFYEGSGSLATQLSDADEHMYTTEDSVGASTFSLDWSDSTLYMIIKDNLAETQANGGVKFVIGDGTDRIGFEVGGNNNVGLPLAKNFNAYRLDVSNRAAFTGHVFAGVLANLTVTAITQIGYGTIHLSKAAGAIDNVWMDGFRYIANGSAVLTINAGTSGTPETFADVAADDITNGWGVVSNPRGNQFIVAAPCEFGESATNTSSFFRQADSQIYLDGVGIGTDNFDFSMLGATGTGTQEFELDNCVVVNVGARANWDFTDANHDAFDLTDTQWIDCGTFTFPANNASKSITRGGFINCDQVYFSGTTVDGVAFNGSNDATGAVLWDENSIEENQDNLSFTSDGTGHAIHIFPSGAGPFTFNIDGYVSSGYEATSDGSTGNTFFLVDSASDADVTINLTGTTGNFAYERASGYTGTVTVVNNVSIEVTGVSEGARVSMHDATGGTERLNALAYTSDGAGAFKASGTYNHGLLGDKSVDVRARYSGYAIAAIADDNTVLTDETESSNTNVTNTMTLLPTTPVANEDRYYIGHTEEFSQLKLDITDAATGATITWQYWNGAWVSLSGVSDGTSNFSSLGDGVVSWTPPGDWATTTVNSQGPYYYVRAVLTAGTPDQARARKAQLDVTRYLPFAQVNTITGSGLSVKASWIVDTVASFN